HTPPSPLVSYGGGVCVCIRMYTLRVCVCKRVWASICLPTSACLSLCLSVIVCVCVGVCMGMCVSGRMPLQQGGVQPHRAAALRNLWGDQRPSLSFSSLGCDHSGKCTSLLPFGIVCARACMCACVRVCVCMCACMCV